MFGAVRSHADTFKMCTADPAQTAAFTAGLNRSIAQLPTQGGTDPISEGQKQRLQFQLNELHRGQMLACQVGSFFFAGRIATLSLSTAAGILALAALAMISKQGWEKTHPVLINIGITTGLVLYSSWTFSQLFGQTANYELYRRKYALAYDTRNSVASAVANGQMTLDGDQRKGAVVSLRSRSGMAELILFIDGRMRQVTNPEISGETGFVESAAERFGRLGGYSAPPPLSPPCRWPHPPTPDPQAMAEPVPQEAITLIQQFEGCHRTSGADDLIHAYPDPLSGGAPGRSAGAAPAIPMVVRWGPPMRSAARWPIPSLWPTCRPATGSL